MNDARQTANRARVALAMLGAVLCVLGLQNLPTSPTTTIARVTQAR